MANWYGTARTNYFKVTNETQYQCLFQGLIAPESNLEDFTKEIDGTIFHGFGAYDMITWEPPVDPEGHLRGTEEYWCDCELDGFLEELSSILTDDSIFILQTIGNEKLRYITADMIILKPKREPEYFSFQDLEQKQLECFFGRTVPDWAHCCY